MASNVLYSLLYLSKYHFYNQVILKIDKILYLFMNINTKLGPTKNKPSLKLVPDILGVKNKSERIMIYVYITVYILLFGIYDNELDSGIFFLKSFSIAIYYMMININC